MSKRADIDDIVGGLRGALDLAEVGDDALGLLESTAGLLRRYREQSRKFKNASPVMRPWHRWRRDRLADRIRERLGLRLTDPIPEPAGVA